MDRSQRSAVVTFALVSLAGMISALVGAFLGDTAQYWLWGLTILLDVIAATIGGRQEGWNIHPEHFSERHGLFTIIALGETLIVAGAGVAGEAWTRSLYEEYLQLESQPGDFIEFYEVLRGLATIIELEGDFQRAKLLEERRLALSREHAFSEGVADALLQLGHQALYLGDTERATQFLQESLTLRKAVGAVTAIAHTQALLGVVACEQGNFAQALLLLHEALELSRLLDDKHGTGWTLSDLGVVAQLQHAYKKAEHYQCGALALARESGYQFMVALVLGRLGNLALIQGDLERAYAYYTESVPTCRQLNMKTRLAGGIEGLAGVAALSNRPIQAAHLLGAAEACYQANGRLRPIEARAIYAQTVAVARTALGEAQFEAAFRTGRFALTHLSERE